MLCNSWTEHATIVVVSCWYDKPAARLFFWPLNRSSSKKPNWLAPLPADLTLCSEWETGEPTSSEPPDLSGRCVVMADETGCRWDSPLAPLNRTVGRWDVGNARVSFFLFLHICGYDRPCNVLEKLGEKEVTFLGGRRQCQRLAVYSMKSRDQVYTYLLWRPGAARFWRYNPAVHTYKTPTILWCWRYY